MKAAILNKLPSKVLYFDLFLFYTSSFIFLYYSPSYEARILLIYIGMQLLICSIVVFVFRVLFRIYKPMRYSESPGFHILNLRLFVSDFFSGIVIYIIELLLPATPSMRISFLQVAIIVGFNLLIGSFIRSVYQCVFDWCEEVGKKWTDA